MTYAAAAAVVAVDKNRSIEDEKRKEEALASQAAAREAGVLVPKGVEEEVEETIEEVENRVRMFSTPHHVFDYFASYLFTSQDGQ